MNVSGDALLKAAVGLLSLVGTAGFGWAWTLSRDVALAEQELEIQGKATVEKLKDMKEDYEDQIANIRTDYDAKLRAAEIAHNKEIEGFKSRMGKIEDLDQKTEQNALALAKIEVKMDSAMETLDEIKKLVSGR